MLRARLRAFGWSTVGQDVAEYCLITALVALVALAVFIHISGGVQAIWGAADTTLAVGSGSSTHSGGAASTSSTSADSGK